MLGAVEFALITLAVNGGLLFRVRLPFAQALQFYLVAWTGAWLTTQVLLPLLWPRWAEGGGELRYALAGSRRVDNYYVPFGWLLMLVVAFILVGLLLTTDL